MNIWSVQLAERGIRSASLRPPNGSAPLHWSQFELVTKCLERHADANADTKID